MQLGQSKFTIGVLTGILTGLFIAEWLQLDLWWVGGIIIGIIFGLVLFWSQILWRWVLFCLLGLFLGVGYFYAYNNIQNKHQLIYDQKLNIEGQIVEPIQVKPTKTQAILEYQNSKILIELPRYPEYQIGDNLSFVALIQNPKSIETIDNFSAQGGPASGWNYGEYLLDKNIRGIVKNPDQITKSAPRGRSLRLIFLKSLYFISDRFRVSLMKILPEPYASFQSGLLLGNRVTQLPDSLTSAFNRAGTTHIVAVSGYNVTIIISILAMCFALFSRRLAFWATLISILFFIIMTGGSASVVRAGILGGLVAWGKLEGRRVNHLILVLVVAFLMLLFNPYQIKGDVSFQLSFLAFAGLIYISPRLQNLKIIRKIPNIIKTVLSETLAAQIAVLPILIYNFGMVSLVAPMTNILILPIIPFAMLLGFIAGITGLIWLQLGKIFALFAWLLLKYTIVIVETFSRFSWAAVNIKTSEWWWIVIYYAVIIYLIQSAKLKYDQDETKY